MAAIQEINRKSPERSKIKSGDIVTIKTRGIDYLHIVLSMGHHPNVFELASIVNGNTVTINKRDIELFKGSAKIYNVL